MLTWTVTGNDATDFEINKNSDQDGVLTFKTSPDFEMPAGTGPMGTADNTYEITVNVRDSKNDDGNADTDVDDSLAVVVTVTNVNDAPTIDSGPTAISKPENTATTETTGHLHSLGRRCQGRYTVLVPGRRRRQRLQHQYQRAALLRSGPGL